VEGVAGSGKTYTLVQSILKNEAYDQPVIITCPTNEGLISAAEELIKAGRNPIHITNDRESPYCWLNILRGDVDFCVYQRYLYNREKTKEEADLFSGARAQLQMKLRKYVMLATPVMSRSIYKQLGFKKEVVSVYVDEGGLMKMIDLLPLLLFNRKRLWVFGDRKQNVPVIKDELDVDNLETLVRAFDQFINTSVSQWFANMDIPKVFIDVCRRLPDDCSRSMVDFFYKEEPSLAFQGYVRSNTFKTDLKPYVSYVPPCLMAYPFLKDRDKEIESVRLSNIVDYYEKSKNRASIVFVVTHNYLKDALVEIMRRKSKKKKEKEWVPPLIYNCHTAQSKTFKDVFFIPAYSATMFMDDRLFLVALSRHKRSLKVADVDVKRFYPFALIWYYMNIGVINDWNGSYEYYKRKERRGTSRYKSWCRLSVEWDKEKLSYEMISGRFSVVRRLATYKKGAFDEQIWLIKNKDISIFVEDFCAGKEIKPGIEPKYKWLMLYAPRSNIGIYRRENSKYACVDINSHWSNEGITVPIA